MQDGYGAMRKETFSCWVSLLNIKLRALLLNTLVVMKYFNRTFKC